jgi:hypothetical protein
MNEVNPFLYSDNPYRKNPFTILGARLEMTQPNIDEFARACERALASGQQPNPELALHRGECKRAAQCLQDPVLRLAFDLMGNWRWSDNEERL